MEYIKLREKHMAQKGKIYRCSICGNIVEVLHNGNGTLVCCGQDMELLQEKDSDVGLEKHVPIIDIQDGKAQVKVGDIPHPMEDSHYIQFVQLLMDGYTLTKQLNPGELPMAEFTLPKEYKNISAREYCNIHGLWSSK